RFAFGNPGGPGNPNVRRASMMKRAIAQAVTPEEVAAVFKAMIAKAIEGDREAGRLVLYYTIGKPDEFHKAMERMEDFDDASAASPIPSTPPATPAPAARRDSSHLLRREEREPSMEEMLGITPPFANGANGPVAAANRSTTSDAD